MAVDVEGLDLFVDSACYIFYRKVKVNRVYPESEDEDQDHELFLLI